MYKLALIGNDIDYSLSPSIHNYLLKKYNISGSYQIYNTPKLDQAVLNKFDGGNITIPHKRDAYALSNLDGLRDRSINTFKSGENGFEFCSTDQLGIIDSIRKLKIPYLKTRLHIIFGDGATSEMIVNTLIDDFKVKAEKIYIISRKSFNLKSSPKIISYQFFKNNLNQNCVLYNTTPLGNGKMSKSSPFAEAEVCNALAIFDVTYNPLYNELGRIAYKNRIKYINGMNMLIVQALHSFKFWTGINVMDDYNFVKCHILKENTKKLIICAMPFAGKTSLYKRHKQFGCDLDSVVESITKMKNNDYITKYGIKQFRSVEAKALSKALDDDSIKVIYLGGGTLTSDAALSLLENQMVVYMLVSLETLLKRFDKSRANIKSEEELIKLYKERDSHYKNISHMQLSSKSIERMINEYLDH